MLHEQQMYDRILGYAREQDDIRAVILNGSRANPDRRPDPFNDFDIVYLVRDVASYKDRPLNTEYGEALFGDMLVYERTDEGELFNDHFPEFVCYLMQFADGNRIDLTIADIKNYHGYCFDDRLSVVLLDKDGVLPALPPPNESTHYITPPTQQLFFECRTEFWWVAPYVSKGLWRGQLLFAHKHLDVIRDMLLQMLKWYTGALHGFARTVGKRGDKLADLLPADIWAAYLNTFPRCTEEEMWQALFDMGALFTEVSRRVAEAFTLSIEDDYDCRVTAFLQYTRDLPRNAETLDFTI